MGVGKNRKKRDLIGSKIEEDINERNVLLDEGPIQDQVETWCNGNSHKSIRMTQHKIPSNSGKVS